MPVNLLIIETDPRFRSNLVQHLVRQGIHVVEADHLQTALKVLDQTPVDVILVNLEGFKREGLHFLRMIRPSEIAPEVITISNPEHIDLSIEGMKLGAFDDLMIPFEIDTLVDRIMAAFHQRARALNPSADPSSKSQNR